MEQYQLFLRRICTSLKGKFNTLLTLSGSSQFIFRSSTLPRKDSEIMQKNFSHNVWFKLHRWTKKFMKSPRGRIILQSIKGGLTANTAELLKFYRTLEENQVKVIMTQTNPPPPLPPPFLLGIYHDQSLTLWLNFRSNPIWVDPYHNWGMKTDDEDAPVYVSPLWYMFSTVTQIMNRNVKKEFFSSLRRGIIPSPVSPSPPLPPPPLLSFLHRTRTVSFANLSFSPSYL